MKEVAEKHAGETIVVCTHGDPLVLFRKAMHDFKYEKQKSRWYISNASEEELPAVVEYVFADTGRKVDLHRPYIDDVIIVNKETGNELNRIPEVLDCWFESGSMPYGQDHWMKS